MTSDGSPDGAPKDTFHIVGVGASAGGLEALEAFFEPVRADSGMAFVVVQHLSPDFKSVMDELLARRTQIPVHRVQDGMTVKPNAIYLIPPKKEMIISSGKLLLTDKAEQGLTLPIDIFLRSLAQDAGPRSIGVILSGTGSDGSRGICDIHEAGGLVIAQEPDSSKFDGMPKSAVETGVVDVVLRPEQMAGALLSYAQHPGADETADWPPESSAILEGVDAIFQLLRKDYGIDFSHYKRTTVMRRVQRRLLMSQITDLDEYVQRLRSDTGELNSLYKDLLIGVTKFFRDAAAFGHLEKKVLPALLTKLRPEDELRVWVAGCATGEEAYSLAMVIHEQLHRMKASPSVKIFATDVHRASLDVASAGVYSEASLSEVSPERLSRYFTRAKSGYHVSQDLRQMIVFAPHNIIKDAPFTKLDLITCRNLLIYLEPLAQKKALSLFHFALNTGGVLFLGPSESPGELADEFDPIDDRWKMYRKRRDRRLPADMRLPLSPSVSQPGAAPAMGLMSPSRHLPDAPLLRAYDTLLQEHAPPSLLINSRRELVQSFSGAAEFLKLRDGRLTADVLELISPELKIPLTTALQQAVKRQAPVVFKGIGIQSESGGQKVKLTVRPIPDRHSDTGHFLVSIEAVAVPARAAEADGDEMDVRQASHERMSALETELHYTRENLQATLEEMETSNEELQATNEELVASNEELQSTNEELHSVNEELYTVNAEYQKKIAELTEMTADMDNLLHSTDVGVIFLDRDLCIRKFTSKIAAAFHLTPSDSGRRIESFAHNIDRPELLADLKRVLNTETPLEVEVQDRDGAAHFLRILPYRSKGKVEGVVLTLIDISRLKQAERDLRLMSKVFQDGADPILIEDLEGRIIDLNSEAERTYGWRREELLGQPTDVLVPAEELLRSRELRARCREKGGVRNVETVRRSKSGETRPVLLTLSLLTEKEGKPVAIASIAKDIGDRKRAEDTAREAVRRRDQFLAMLSHELRNPLGAVLNATYLIDRDPKAELSPPLAAACRIIQRQTLQVARLLDDLLDVSRVTQGKIHVRRDTLDLTELVNDAVHAVRPMIDAREHQLHVEVSQAPLYVEGDAARLLQIQENLLTNAAKYTPPKGQIRLSVIKEDDEAVIRVRDNGRGIPAHMLETIFDMFVQSDDTLDRSDGGMGLGLTLVKTLVSLHGGQITVQSDGVGKGSEFIVRLPLAKAPATAPSQTARLPANATGRHILIVEDNPDSRAMLEALLKLEGFQTSAAEDGRHGLEAILRQRPDIAIIDIGLPGMSGYDVARNVRQELKNESIRLIALTGYGRREDCEAVRRAGFDAHLVKPLKPDELTRILTQCADESQEFDAPDGAS